LDPAKKRRLSPFHRTGWNSTWIEYFTPFMALFTKSIFGTTSNAHFIWHALSIIYRRDTDERRIYEIIKEKLRVTKFEVDKVWSKLSKVRHRWVRPNVMFDISD